MSLVKRTNGGLTPFRTLLSDFFDADDFMFNRLFKNEGMPAVNISETDKNFEIELAAPGMEKINNEKIAAVIAASRRPI